MLLQDHNQRRNTCSKKDVSRQPDNGIYIIGLNKIPANFPFSFAICVHISTEKYSMRQYDGENAIGFEMMQFVKQESIVGFTLRCNSIILETRIEFTIRGIPMLRIRRIWHNRIHIEWFTNITTYGLQRPVFIQRISTTGINIIWLDTTHHEIHSGKVIGILLQLLSIILHLVFIGDMAANGFANGNQQRTGTTCRVIYFNLLFILMMLCYNLRHQHRHLVRSIEFTSFLSGIGCKITDEILINIAQHVVILTAIGRNVFNELNQILQSTGLRRRILPQFTQSGL